MARHPPIKSSHKRWNIKLGPCNQWCLSVVLISYLCKKNLGLNLLKKIVKIADNTKLTHKAAYNLEQDIIQQDLNKIFYSLMKWQLSFNLNVKQCIVIAWSLVKKFRYTLGWQALKDVVVEPDFGVLVLSDFRFSKYCVELPKKTNWIILRYNFIYGFIAQYFEYKSRYGNLII